MYCIPKKKQTEHEKASLCCRRNLSWVGNVCEAPNDSTNYWKCVSEICLHPDGQINKGFFNRPIMAHTQILGGLEQEF